MNVTMKLLSISIGTLFLNWKCQLRQHINNYEIYSESSKICIQKFPVANLMQS